MEPWNTQQASEFWNKELDQYGRSPYVEAVLDIILKENPDTVFELAISNGRSFVGALLTNDVEVHGCDISKFLIEELQKNYPAVVAYQAGYGDFLEKEKKDFYDLVYCLRSSWYFSDILLALQNMLEITKPGGKVIIDVMNKDSEAVKSSLLACRKKRRKQKFKNVIKYIFNKFFGKKYKIEVVFDLDKPESPAKIEKFLENKNLSFEKFSYEQIIGKSKITTNDSMRYLYIISK